MTSPSQSMKINKLASGLESEEDCSWDWVVIGFPETLTPSTVTLDGILFDRVLDINFEETTVISTHPWINKSTPTLDDDVWNKEAERIILQVRASHENK